jgi:hypothetical protein
MELYIRPTYVFNGLMFSKYTECLFQTANCGAAVTLAALELVQLPARTARRT